ncbi:rCG46895, partial [Rattus norvegicus]
MIIKLSHNMDFKFCWTTRR